MQSILTLQPIYHSKIWGGRKLESIYNRKIPFQKQIGEAWEVSDFEGSISIITNGELKGITLNQCMKLNGQEVFGFQEDHFPLLVKIIDAKENLSVQVHPTNKYVKEKDPKANSKIEAWYILHASSDAKIYCGFNQTLTRETYFQAVQENRAEEFLKTYSVKTGDAFLLKPGTIHAIGSGCLILEVQQASDTTYRVYDYGRLDEQGKQRDLHLDKALDVIRFKGSVGQEKLSYIPIEDSDIDRYFLTNNYMFHLEYWNLQKEIKLKNKLSTNRSCIITVLDGVLQIPEEGLEFQNGDSFIVTVEGMSNITLKPKTKTSILVSVYNGESEARSEK